MVRYCTNSRWPLLLHSLRLPMSHQYDSEFMSYTDQSSRHSATVICKLLKDLLPIHSVLDIGCAKGTWLAIWADTGVETIRGVDGAYVDQSSLVIPKDRFTSADLSSELHLAETFDLVQSLEVAEHISSASADIFVDNLVRHSNGLILFSAAPPGQGGEFHVNEQPYDYWQSKFAHHGYQAIDCIRPQLQGQSKISFWYRYNTVLYAHKNKLSSLPAQITDCLVADGLPIPDISPIWFKLRKKVVSLLPASTRNYLAVMKSRLLS